MSRFHSVCHPEKVVRPNLIYWSRGIHLDWPQEAYCLVEEHSSSCVRITVPASCKGAVIFKSDNCKEICICEQSSGMFGVVWL